MIKALQLPTKLKIVLPLLGGALYALGFPHTTFPTFFLFPIVGLIFFFSSLRFPHLDFHSERLTLKSELIALLLFSFSYCLVGYYWIPHTLKTFGHIPFPVNFVLGSLFSLIIVPHLLLFILGHHFISRLKLRRLPLIRHISARNLFYALIFTVLEYYTPQQFPAHIGHPWLSLAPYIGLAPLFGAPIFSLMSFWAVMAGLTKLRNGILDKWFLISLFVFMIINISLPLTQFPHGKDERVQVRLVQANIGNFLKLSSEAGGQEERFEVYNRYRDLSLQDLPKTDLIIWPETAYPSLLSSDLMKDYPSATPQLFQDVIDRSGAELLVGGYDRSASSQKSFQSEYNTVFHFSSNKKLKELYHKIKLIPFGEGLPFGPLNHFFSKLIRNISYFASGTRYPVFETASNVPFTTIICYEALFSSFLRDYLNLVPRQPHFLVNVTNDSWYGDTSEPYQHLFLSHWRAIEFQLPLLRLTNTGITSLLYPDGSESKRLGIAEKSYLDVEVITGKTSRPTLFQNYGVSLTVFLGLFWMLIIYFSQKFLRL